MPNYVYGIFSQVPVVAVGLFGGLAALLAFLCDIHTLAEFLSIGTLIVYTIVCMNVCILRYCQMEAVQSISPSIVSFTKLSYPFHGCFLMG